ncbi:MAG: squalene--hopene cyclase [Phycisphaeraceae bacterium]|nr:squalene--hopene cyclase [Phycisphaeraceae bacterium]
MSDTPLADATQELLATARNTHQNAVKALMDIQQPEGYWCAELEGDSILQSEYVLLKWIIDQEDDPRIPKIVKYLRKQQTADGSFVQYPGGKIDLSATVKAYFVFKLAGDDPQAPHMVKAREQIHAHGGAEMCNSFTNFYLAALGQIDYNAVPSIPPEIIMLPKWFYFHLDKVSAWSRTMITPLSIVTSHRPVRKLSDSQGIGELYLDQTRRNKLKPTTFNQHRTWTTIFYSIDKVLKLIEKTGVTPLRRRALQRVEDWIIDHTDRSDGMGAIFPPMVYILIALRARGYADDHPKILEAHKHLDDLMIHDEVNDEIRIQPCFSPIWDTGIAAYALTELGFDRKDNEAADRCANWLLSKECRKAGDWLANVKDKNVEPSGWFFEYNNGFYPDVDDTVMVAMALWRMGGEDAKAAAKRGVNWILAMQNDDGGWAAFDKTDERPILEHVPFADHNAIQDPSCPDITGRTLECMGHLGYDQTHPAISRAIGFIRSRQEHDGCWFGRWGVNYFYGTWQVVGGLYNIGYNMAEDWIQKAGQWIKDHQQADGSFGESCDTYEDESLRGTGPSTASQSAWAVMSLLAIYGPSDPDVQRGIQWLCDTQLKEDHPTSGDKAGSWHEPWFTGTGFPKVFYLRYHLYRLYFPIMAIGRWMRLYNEKFNVSKSS